jgi:hypothetical protein
MTELTNEQAARLKALLDEAYAIVRGEHAIRAIVEYAKLKAAAARPR